MKYDISPDIIAFSTSRNLTGFSVGAYGRFNINEYCGDDESAVMKNRQLLAERLGIDVRNIVMPHQTHGTEVRRITPDTRKDDLEGVDAITTNDAGILIGVSTADCIPIIIYDPERRAVATVHAGWRGTVARIAEITIGEMGREYGSCPERLLAQIGPGISLDAFEVGDEVYEKFASANFPMERIARRYPSSEGADKWHIDLWECNRLQLLASGLQAQNIRVAGVCTYCHADEYFSARRLSVNSGRIFTGAMIRG